MDLERLIQPFLICSLVVFMFTLFFFTIPPENNEILKMCLTSLISFISGSSIALALVRASRDRDKKG